MTIGQTIGEVQTSLRVGTSFPTWEAHKIDNTSAEIVKLCIKTKFWVLSTNLAPKALYLKN